MIRYLRKIKYEINNFIKPLPLIPENFDLGKWKDNSETYNLLKLLGKDLTKDLNLVDMKIFGQPVNLSLIHI